jgi:putative hydrolase of the HAD superfamily
VRVIRCILFDLGGVLVRFRGVERVAELLGDAEVGEAHWQQWLGSPAVRTFELGRLSPEEFAETFLAEFGLGLSPEELLRELHGFVGGPFDGAVELLDELRTRYLVACLSNTNRLHWPPLASAMGLDRRLHRAFPSYETGFLKPDAEAFEHVCHELDLTPAEILFFDDARLNIEAASALGFEACQVQGPVDCQRELERRGLLPGAR